tara:strand:- start:552 stop:1364 length:813 start_codon:yes stop_codon:yes gene_type:complete
MVRKLGIFLENSTSQLLLQQLNSIKDYPTFTEKTALIEHSINSIIDKKYYLYLDAWGLSLLPFDKNLHGKVHTDFISGKNNYRRITTNRRSDLARACGITNKNYLSILDGTAGLGIDGFMLSSLNCKVKLVEKNPVIFALLRDGVRRLHLASAADKLLKVAYENISYVCGDTERVLAQQKLSDMNYDVIYLDPMFPLKQKESKSKKAMQALQYLSDIEDDYNDLLNSAIDSARKRVVIKRPLRSDYLCKKEPTLSLKGSSVRFDVFIKSS